MFEADTLFTRIETILDIIILLATIPFTLSILVLFGLADYDLFKNVTSTIAGIAAVLIVRCAFLIYKLWRL